jgi:hypothetical protein
MGLHSRRQPWVLVPQAEETLSNSRVRLGSEAVPSGHNVVEWDPRGCWKPGQSRVSPHSLAAVASRKAGGRLLPIALAQHRLTDLYAENRYPYAIRELHTAGNPKRFAADKR